MIVPSLPEPCIVASPRLRPPYSCTGCAVILWMFVWLHWKRQLCDQSSPFNETVLVQSWYLHERVGVEAGSVGFAHRAFVPAAGRPDGADAGGQSRQDGHGSSSAGSRRRRQHPGRRGLDGAHVRQRARPRRDRQAAAGPAGLWRHAQRQCELCRRTLLL